MPLEYETDETLEASTNRWMAVGAGLLITMALVFPFYRWYEPAARDDAREQQTADLAAEGETVWSFNCSSCHGLNGEGVTAPALNSTEFLQSATDDQIGLLVSVGIPGTQMSAFSLDHGGPLTSEQIKSVVTFIRSWEPDAPDRPDWRDMVGG
jgi:mono/diheme cytochrome c family protein